MNHTERELLLDSLIATWENEAVEFKQAGNDYDAITVPDLVSRINIGGS